MAGRILRLLLIVRRKFKWISVRRNSSVQLDCPYRVARIACRFTIQIHSVALNIVVHRRRTASNVISYIQIDWEITTLSLASRFFSSSLDSISNGRRPGIEYIFQLIIVVINCIATKRETSTNSNWKASRGIERQQSLRFAFFSWIRIVEWMFPNRKINFYSIYFHLFVAGRHLFRSEIA